VDKSLVVAAEDNDGARFSLLEPVRQFALLMLRTADEVTATRDRHTQYYVQRSRQAFLPTQLGDETWFRRVEADYDNFRTAISWALSADNRRGARWITSNLVFFWIWKRMMTEGARWLDQALGDSDWDRPEALGALIGGAFLSIQLGESERAKQYIDAGVTSARAVGDDAALGWGLQTLAMVDDRTGATHTPHALVEEVLALGEERVGTGPYLYGLGRRGANQWWRGELAAAEATLTDALQRARNEGLDQYDALYNEILCRVRADRGDFDGAEGAFRDAVDRRWQGVAVVTPMLYQEHGRILACRGDFDEANREFDHARSLVVDNDVAADGWAHHAVAVLFRAAADLPGAVEAVDDMPPALRLSYMERWQSVVAAAAGVVAIIRGNAEEARSKFSESLEAAQREQRLLYVPVAELGLAAIELAQGNPQKASARIIAALDDFLAMDARPSVVHALEEAASVAVAVDDHIGAARLFGAAKAERARIGYVEGPHVAAHYEPFRSTIRSALGEQAASAREEGRRMSLAEAVAYARGNRGPRRRPATGWDSLTPAELSVVRLVRDGLSNPRIAEQLFISTRTVTTHLTHVYTKLGITSRTELATAAVERGA
jgi:DNA-binding CsgD family transcriptional regulator/tetratricopeptide (TPR) repeat protein